MALFDDLLTYLLMAVGLYSLFFYADIFLENKGNIKSPKAKRYPKVSVLIPAYNEGGVIEKTINTVLEMDYPRKEIIVVDDGSSDSTLKEARRFERKGVKVLTKENRGHKADAVNFGLKRCSGEYIFILDADSFPERDSLKKMVGYLEDPEVAAVIPSMKPWRPRNVIEKLQVIEYVLTSFFRKSMSFVEGLSVTPGAPLIRKSFIDRHGGFDVGNITEDLEFGLRIKEKEYKIAHAYDTTIYTMVPSTVKGLYRQRLRWNYGALVNLKKYSHLFSPKYGDFGLFILPSVLFFIGFIGLTYIYYTGRFIYELFRQVHLARLISFDIFQRKISLDLYQFLSFISDPKMVLLAVALVFSVVVYNAARKGMKERFSLAYIPYVFVYGLVLNMVTVASLWCFIRRRKPSW
ncbi:hypothetical protein A3K63_04210 [Candidatus Micrarchaeota archaeon RBG_16_49_10]|nr:MAG: hypothetical protein A3K63_04210 [Candidatus Micrarchaeota archaeon RBG_16_49_10]